MNRAFVSALTCALLALPLSARARPQAETPAAKEAAPAGDDVEFVGDDAPQQVEATSEGMPLPDSAADVDDKAAPLIEDLAVAAGNPTTSPMITAVITDDWSGVERAEIFFRRTGELEYQKTTLSPGAGGLFIGRLPDGLQKSGFEYYVEVWDAAKNGPARMGTPEAPLPVAPAKEGTLQRIERQEREALAGPVHPGWVMLAMGTGVVATAVSSWFWYDLFKTVLPGLETVNQNLASPNLSEADRQKNLEAQLAYEQARTGNLAIGSIVGVVGVAALGTGIALMIASVGE